VLVDVAERGDEDRRVGRVETVERHRRHGDCALVRTVLER
jgi:hypothetical protein